MGNTPTMSKKILLLIIAFQLIVSIVLSAVIIVLVKRHESSNDDEAISLGNNSQLGLNEDNLTLTQIRLYWHDILSGSNPSAIRILPPVSGSSTSFGQVNMIDDPMTEGPELSSKLVARAQGFYALASQEEVGMLMAMNFAFVDGEYNGSTITVLGRNTIMSAVREMPVIGGSGVFRLARGYVEAKTNKVSFNSGDAVVEYNVHVLHY